MANIASRHRYTTNTQEPPTINYHDDGEEPTSGLSYGKETITIDVYTTSIDGLSFSVVSGDGFVANRVVGKAARGRFVYMNRVCSRCVDGW